MLAANRRKWLVGAFCAVCAVSIGSASWIGGGRKRILIVTEIELISPRQFDRLVSHLGGKEFLHEIGYDVEYLDSKIGDKTAVENAIARVMKHPPEILVVLGDDEAVAFRKALPNVPLVFWSNSDPTTIGLAETFYRPGGFATGATSDWAGNTKPVELIAEVLRSVDARDRLRVAVMSNSRWFAPARTAQWNVVAVANGIELEVIAAETYAQLLEHPRWIAVEEYDAVILPISTPRVTHVEEIVRYLSSRKVLNLFENFGALVKGGALGYQAERPDWPVELGTAIRLVIDGAEPGDIPIRGPDAWTFAVNNTALAQLGRTLTPATKALISRVF